MAQLAAIKIGDHYAVADPDCLIMNGYLVKVEAVLPGRWLLVSFATRSLRTLKAWGVPIEENTWYPVRPRQVRRLTDTERSRLQIP